MTSSWGASSTPPTLRIEVDTQGDAFFVVFTTPQAAIEAAVAAPDAPLIVVTAGPVSGGADRRNRTD